MILAANSINHASVPGQAHYSTQYLRCGRIFSYAHQIHAVLGFEPRTVLEVGAGGGMVTAALRSTGIDVTTVDVQPELDPTVVASVTELPFHAEQFDVALCCQVLEHLPFEMFPVCLSELGRVAKNVVISLPDVTRYIEATVRLPKLGRRSFAWSPSLGSGRTFPANRINGEHFWEIGFREFPLRAVTSAISSAGLSLDRTWRVSELSWHRFFVLRHRRG